MADAERIAEQIDTAAAEKAAAAVAVAEDKIAEAERTTEAMALATAHGAHSLALEAHKKEVETWRASDLEARRQLEGRMTEHTEILKTMSSILERLSSEKSREAPAKDPIVVVEPTKEPEPKEKSGGDRSAPPTSKKTRRFL